METLDRLDVPKLRLERIEPEEKNVTCVIMLLLSGNFVDCDIT